MTAGHLFVALLVALFVAAVVAAGINERHARAHSYRKGSRR